MSRTDVEHVMMGTVFAAPIDSSRPLPQTVIDGLEEGDLGLENVEFLGMAAAYLTSVMIREIENLPLNIIEQTPIMTRTIVETDTEGWSEIKKDELGMKTILFLGESFAKLSVEFVRSISAITKMIEAGELSDAVDYLFVAYVVMIARPQDENYLAHHMEFRASVFPAQGELYIKEDEK